MQYTLCMKVCIDGNLGLSREYHKKLVGLLLYSWCNCPLRQRGIIYRYRTYLINRGRGTQLGVQKANI